VYDYYTGKLIGRIDNPPNLADPPDDSYADLLTCGWDQIDPEYGGGEVLANGPLTTTIQSGQVYIQAKVGSYWDPSVDLYDEYGWYTWINHVIVYVSYGLVGMGDATFVGYVSVQETSKTQYYVDPAGESGPFNYIYIFCWTPPWYLIDYFPHEYNNVLIDTGFVWGYHP
jgi:hypothetical protein